MDRRLVSCHDSALGDFVGHFLKFGEPQSVPSAALLAARVRLADYRAGLFVLREGILVLIARLHARE